MAKHECNQEDSIETIKEDIGEIKVILTKQEGILSEHIRRTEALEKIVNNNAEMFDRFERMDNKNKAFVYKVLIGAIVGGLLPFLLKLL